jgi:hypothetical protein
VILVHRVQAKPLLGLRKLLGGKRQYYDEPDKTGSRTSKMGSYCRLGSTVVHTCKGKAAKLRRFKNIEGTSLRCNFGL